jgi:hypothetical protein
MTHVEVFSSVYSMVEAIFPGNTKLKEKSKMVNS